MLERSGALRAQSKETLASLDLLRQLNEMEQEYLKTHTEAEWSELNHEAAKDVATQYAVTMGDYEKVWDPTTQGYVCVRKVKT